MEFVFFTFVLFCSLFVFSWISPREPVPDRIGGIRRAYCLSVRFELAKVSSVHKNINRNQEVPSVLLVP